MPTEDFALAWPANYLFEALPLVCSVVDLGAFGGTFRCGLWEEHTGSHGYLWLGMESFWRLCLLYFFPWQFSGVSHYRLSMRLVHRVRVGSWVAHAWVGSGLRALLFVFCLWLELGIVLFCWLLIVFCDLPTTVWGTPGHLHVRVTTHPTV
jgi:hypothetical protein